MPGKATTTNKNSPNQPFGVGDSIGMLTLVVVMLNMVVTVPAWMKALLLLPIVAGIFFFIRRSVWTENWEEIHKWTAAAALSVLVLFVGISQAREQWRNEHSRIVLSYAGRILDGQKVVLSKEKEAIKGNALPLNMFVEPNDSTMFHITGIGMLKNGEPPVSLEHVCFQFSPGIQASPSTLSSWQQGNNNGNLFCLFYGRAVTITEELPIMIPDFSGGPLPESGVKVTVHVYYGKSAESSFTILPPD
jgi:hypothetical protein